LFIIILLFKIKVDATLFNTTTTNSIFNVIISAAWKIIKTWLPAGAVKKIKFLSKANVGEYVEEDQRPAQWGGKKMFIN
jgi:CRAL/TRIO domain